MARYLCVHCHFYQPPRENPWLEAVELQEPPLPTMTGTSGLTPSVTLPNARRAHSRRNRRIAKIVNNYAKISFNFGPTLLSWMERNEPHVL